VPASNFELAVIVALTNKGVMGRNNALPWHLPEDLKRFKLLTMGHPIIMGRKTFESIGRALPGRLNIVITRQGEFKVPEGVVRASGLQNAINIAMAKNSKAFVIGGASLIEESLPLADKLYVTWIEKDFDGDVIIASPQEKFKDFSVLNESFVSEPFPHNYKDYIRKIV